LPSLTRRNHFGEDPERGAPATAAMAYCGYGHAAEVPCMKKSFTADRMSLKDLFCSRNTRNNNFKNSNHFKECSLSPFSLIVVSIWNPEFLCHRKKLIVLQLSQVKLLITNNAFCSMLCYESQAVIISCK
jgi:hypothetical protein